MANATKRAWIVRKRNGSADLTDYTHLHFARGCNEQQTVPTTRNRLKTAESWAVSKMAYYNAEANMNAMCCMARPACHCSAL